MSETLPDRPTSDLAVLLRKVVRASRLFRLRLKRPGILRHGEDVAVGRNLRLLSPTRAEFGNRVRVGADFFAEVDFVVGDDVLVSSRVSFIGDDHEFGRRDRTVFAGGRKNEHAAVLLQGDNLIGHGTIVIAPAVIGRGTIVGAGSLVRGNLPAGQICFGRPAKPVRARWPEE